MTPSPWRTRRTRWTWTRVVLAAALALALVIAVIGVRIHHGRHASSSTPAASAGGSVGSAQLAAATRTLAQIRTIAAIPRVGGYQRACGPGDQCSFGPSWTDDNSIPGTGHNDCSTRNDVLARDLTQVQYRRGSRCVVSAGVLADPYSGRRIEFSKAHPDDVQIDHLYPLGLAWRMGASSWSQQTRINFANDTRLNLTAVDGADNQAKGDQGPGSWMPPNRGYYCQYAVRYLAVAAAYQLPITRADHRALSAALDQC